MDDQQTPWIAMGYIKGASGVKGWLKVAVSTEDTGKLLDYPTWRLSKEGFRHFVRLLEGRINGDVLQAKLEGIDDRDAASALRGFTVEINRADFAETAKDEYYWADLIGLGVYNREAVHLGEVVQLLQTGAHDVLVVHGEYGEKLIPFVAHYIDNVCLTDKRIDVDWGMDY